jgi:hypothetical protein
MSRDRYYYESMWRLEREQDRLISMNYNNNTDRYGRLQEISYEMRELSKTDYERQQDYYRAVREVNKAEAKKQKEMEANIPKRALMLEKVSSDTFSLPQLPSVLWKEIAEYEGGVESALLGEEQTNNGSWCPWSWCSIL